MYVPYCTSDGYSGRRDASDETGGLMMAFKKMMTILIMMKLMVMIMTILIMMMLKIMTIKLIIMVMVRLGVPRQDCH